MTVATKKMKKSLESINPRLQLLMKSGKYVLRYKQTENEQTQQRETGYTC